MSTLRVATFNIENLLRRFDFYRYGQLTKERALEILGVEPNTEEGWLLRKSLFVSLTDDTRQITGQAISDTDADIVCLQDLDNRQVLDDFEEYYVKRAAGAKYGWLRLKEGNDRRGIDVAVMSRQWISVESHKDVTFADFDLFNDALDEYGLRPGDPIFRRDCLEVETNVDGKRVTIFVCHFKSMSGGRSRTQPVRHAEASAVRQIIENKFGSETAQSDWIIAGDLNDYVDDQGNSGLGPLLNDGFSVNVVNNLGEADRWTHYWAGGNSSRQLDYLLLSPALGEKNPNCQPTILRNGMAYRTPGLDQVTRYPRVGIDRPKASDHCPVAATLKI